MLKKNSFTLVEMLFVILIISILLPIIFSSYTRIQQQKHELDLRQKLYQQTYEVLERMNVLLQDYTVDYEEYFNRQMVGCVGTAKRWNSFERNIWGTGHCTNFTAYGNENSVSQISNGKARHVLYYCNSSNMLEYNDTAIHTIQSQSACQHSSFVNSPYRQSYGQYSKLFYDVKSDTDLIGGLVGDSDDENLWVWPKAIAHATGIQELYFISQDGKSRLFFRRNLAQTGDFDGDWYANSTWEKLYVIQILRLRGFDAGTLHDFSKTDGNVNPWLYDGQIDTWACDASQGFIGHWSGVGGAYSGYKLPNTPDDCREDRYQGDTTVDAWNLTIYPDTDPQLAWKSNTDWTSSAYQINPYVKVFMLNKIYLPRWRNKLQRYFQDFQIAVETIFNTRSSYMQ